MARKGGGSKTYWKRTFTNVIFDVQISQIKAQKKRNRNVHIGYIVPCSLFEQFQYISAWAISSCLS